MSRTSNAGEAVGIRIDCDLASLMTFLPFLPLSPVSRIAPCKSECPIDPSLLVRACLPGAGAVVLDGAPRRPCCSHRSRYW